ncbi:F5/8 type C domain-containing protein [Pseudoxanthomonas sp. GM95]|uniref:discoidin domain-containing protein n=1 Tax=Pseudoxanthomonas sp. GM95 TaxID=1881043 RepID=UPI0008BCEF5F|nr:discoidin domain-containing protein [Pseudoxanthomonas sp. GM95]SEM09537.1 F5/8 type C domain-containing protein [Pseudoxanthomonas sp. GM95]
MAFCRSARAARPFSLLFLLAGVLPALASAADNGLPPRSQWKASSSSTETPALASPLAFDGDLTTRWGGAFSAGHWLQVDLGAQAEIGGVRIAWDTSHANAYSIQASDDGQAWRTVYQTTDSPGRTEYALFPAVKTRYLRLAAAARTADWGVGVREFQPLSAADAPKIRGVSGKDAATLWSSGPARALKPQGRAGYQLDIALPQPQEVAGLEIAWGKTPASATLEARDADGRWSVLADAPNAFGVSTYLAADAPRTVTALRLQTRAAGQDAPSVTRVRPLGPQAVMTPMKRYQLAATGPDAALFPSSLKLQQVYWTVVGIPAGRQKAVFDEYGNLEAFKGAPLVQPVWRDASGRAAAATADTQIEHRLRAGWMPMPEAQWSPQPGLELTSSAIAIEHDGAPVVLVRHRLRNTGTTPIEGMLSLLTRPMQVSPPWQNGGLSPIRQIAVEDGGVRVNGRLLFQGASAPDVHGVAAFGAHGEDEITRFAAAGSAPNAQQADDPSGLAAGLLGYRVQLAPGAQRDIVLAFALGNEVIDAKTVEAARWPAAPTLDVHALLGDGDQAGAKFDALADALAAQWEQRLGRIGLSLPDPSLVDMLRAQAAYMLLNQSGPAMQPGPRNYNRSFIRDGSATAAVLLRMGMAKTARDYLHWYSTHAVHDNGLVSPILNDDGSVNTGFGSDLEYDAQGEYLWLVAEVARLDGGAQTVRDYQPQVNRALKFLQELRERTLVPGYQADRPMPERFAGLIAPSISHEGYSVPTHSYWDNYWALRGWHDGAWLADQWGDHATAKWAREQYQLLHDSLAASIRATMQWKGIDTIPADADQGGSDPTSVSIALDPTGAQDVLPVDALANTFDRYLAEVRKRDTPDALYAYTPYEMRNVLTYVHLDRPADAEFMLQHVAGDRRPAAWQELAEVIYSDKRHAIYLGDMPHTWIGAEYARSVFGMLMFEGDDALSLLPGTPPSWVAGPGLKVDGLPTAYGTLAMQARQEGQRLTVTLGKELKARSALKVYWPNRMVPKSVTVDGKAVRDFDAQGLRLQRPFKTLVAQW